MNAHDNELTQSIIQSIEDNPIISPTWAKNGDKTRPNNTEITQGWPQTDIPPSRQRFNWILYYVSQAVNYLLQRGISNWDSAQTYPRCARVVASNGKTYSAKTNNPSGNPTSSDDWELWGFTSDDVKAIARSSGLPVGTVIFFLSSTPPVGFLAANGQQISKSAYSDLWSMAQRSGSLVDQTAWTNNKRYGCFYRVDDDSSIFGLPDLRDRFLRAYSSTDSRTFGSYESNSFPALYLQNPVETSHDWYYSESYGIPADSLSSSTDAVPFFGCNLYAGAESHPAKIVDTDGSIGESSQVRPNNVNLLACIKT